MKSTIHLYRKKECMKFTKSMKTAAWLLDEDMLLRGTIKRKWLRHIFIPDNKGCGFSYQYVTRKDIGKTLFYDDTHIVYSGYMGLERIY